ncbi:hypothetical protein HPCPY6261_0609 [Helicobacter pylori CPY6261]|nr:hypothetical protein HPCPY6261_0609 [Helicobacter pylori CPY6261]
MWASFNFFALFSNLFLKNEVLAALFYDYLIFTSTKPYSALMQ